MTPTRLAQVADPTPLRERMVDACRAVVRAELARAWTPTTPEEQGRFDEVVEQMLAPWAESLPGTQRSPLGERAVATRVEVPVSDQGGTSEVLRMVLEESYRRAIATRRDAAAALGIPYATLSSWYRGSDGGNGRTLAVEVLAQVLGRIGWDLTLVATRRMRPNV